VPSSTVDTHAFSLASARAAGLPGHRLRTGAFVHLSRDVYLAAPLADDLRARCDALTLVMPEGARFSHQTAAALYGAPVAAGTVPIHVSVPAGVVVPRRRPGLVTHQRVLEGPPVLLGGLPVTAPEQVFLDLSPVLGPRSRVVLGDYLVNALTDPGAIAQYLRERPRTRGIVAAREALGLVRVGAKSPQETLLRLHIVEAGLPEPEVNRPAFDAAGGWLGEPDLGYFEQLIAVQYDGDIHRTNPRRWRQDIARDEGFRDAGWLVLRATADDVARPARFVSRLGRHLKERS